MELRHDYWVKGGYRWVACSSTEFETWPQMVQPIPQNPSQQLLHNRTTGNAQFWTYAHIWTYLFIQSDHLFALFIINLNPATNIIISSQLTTSAHFFQQRRKKPG